MTNLFPFGLSLEANMNWGDLIKSVKEQLRAVPEKGMGYGLLRYLHPETSVNTALATNDWDMVFNYLGQIDNIIDESSWFTPASEAIGRSKGALYPFDSKLMVDGFVVGQQLTFSWSYSTRQYHDATIEQLAQQYLDQLTALVEHCMAQTEVAYTPSDYDLPASVDYQDLTAFLNEVQDNGQTRQANLQDLYRLSPMQEGILFHSLYNETSSAYTEQFTFDFPEGVGLTAFESSWKYIVENHDILRTSFYYEELSVPVQVVNKKARLPIKVLDYVHYSEQEQEQAVAAFIEADRQKGFDFSNPPLMRIHLLKLSPYSYKMVWTFHHILLDGWSTSVLMGELLTVYEKLESGTVKFSTKADHYGDYIKYINAADAYAEEQFWTNYLAGFSSPSLLPFVGNVLDRNKGGATSKEVHLNFSEEQTSRVKAFAKAHQLTVNTVIQGVWSLLLSRYTGNKDTVFGVTVSGRPTDLASAEYGIGLYINTLAVRSQIAEEQSVVDWLNQLQKGHTEAREYQYSTLNNVQNWAGINGDFFDSILVFENYPMGELLSRDWKLKVENINIKEQTNYLLSIIVN
ncbi:MAG: condensation domain-containing protein, partial [Bacteroidota bacterium]